MTLDDLLWFDVEDFAVEVGEGVEAGEEVGAEDAVGFRLDVGGADEAEVDDEDGGFDGFGIAEFEGGVGGLPGLGGVSGGVTKGGAGVGDLEGGAVGGFDVEDGVFGLGVEEEFELGVADFDLDDHADVGGAHGDGGEAHFFASSAESVGG